MYKVMVVDDEPDITRTIQMGLEIRGWTVYAYTDPLQAVADIESYKIKPDMLLTDIRMPGIDGFVLSRRAKTACKELKVILLTAYEIELKEFRKMLPVMRIDGFIKKPVAISTIADIITGVMSRKKKKTLI